MKKVISLAAAAVLCLSLAGCGGKSESVGTTAAEGTQGQTETSPEAPPDYHISLKLSHIFSSDDLVTKTMETICNQIRERTDGAIDIQHYPQGQLASYKEGIEQVVNGAEFISVESPSYLGDYVADFKVLSGPMLVSSFEEYEYLLETDEVKNVFQQAEKQGIKVLSLGYAYGFRNLMTNQEITKPADLKGMKIRTPGSQIYVDTINNMGAAATPLAPSEINSAIEKGVIDGLENTLDSYVTNGNCEAAKNVALTRHLLGVCGAYINIDVWNDIPEYYRNIIEEEFTRGAEEMVKEAAAAETATRERLEKEMGVSFNEVDMDAFREAVAPVYRKMEGVTPELYDTLKEKLAAMPK